MKKQSFIVENLFDTDYYKVEKIDVHGNFKDEVWSNFKIYSVLDGEVNLKYGEENLSLRKGENCFIPAKLDLEIEGKAEMLKTYI